VALRNVRPIPVPSSIFHPISFPSPGFSFRQLTREKKNTDVESDQESWTGIAAAADIEREHEYSDEEQLATVTVVEDFDPSVLRHYSTNPDAEQQQQRPLLTPQPLPPPRSLSREKASRSDGGSGAKNVKVKVRYETKAARKATRATQRARRTEKAERAGGKAARKKAGGGGGGKKSRARKK
jgi:ribosomal RNA-processing protein 17